MSSLVTPPTLRDLPEVLPLFPLTGSLLLPGNWMPLNVFEPRYRTLVEDLLESDAPYLGMIQPVLPRNDNFGPDPMFVDLDDPPLYQVGCAGQIARCEQQDDGRYMVLLRGVCRFRVREELEAPRGYRQVRVGYGEFAGDLVEPEALIDPDPILAALREFARQHDLEFDLARLETLPGVSLLNGLAVALPFSPGEKQALLEAEGPGGRRELLLHLMGMGFALGDGELYSPPTVH
ncbi:MAG TPA: LON peptidase substrate-binding domain-containing protein [Thermoanaerobaculia bacterium]|nr:LON peptidase substrate-binding domain-containing protein [Thermoanaerobaculia bacterium]